MAGLLAWAGANPLLTITVVAGAIVVGWFARGWRGRNGRS